MIMTTTVREAFETMAYGPAPEADKPALEWLSKHDAKFGHFVDGSFTKPGGKTCVLSIFSDCQ